jgi:ubiquitin C-terminal hydrolase
MSVAILSPQDEPLCCIAAMDEDDTSNQIIIEVDALLYTNSADANDDVSIPSLCDDMQMDESDAVVEYTFGGLKNLGNTCYLNSALQMLASLDNFSPTLESFTPLSQDADKLLLKHEFVTLIQSLQNGETVRPDAFKKAFDQRSTLFIGYRQQDAHEFLTTLLNLLDEVYLQAPNNSTSLVSDVTGQEGEKQEDCIMDDVNQDDGKIKSDVGPLTDENSSKLISNDPPVAKLSSFRDLAVDQITELLHGDKKLGAPHLLIPQMPLNEDESHPQCKLIGGRAVVVADENCPMVIASDKSDRSSSSSSGDTAVPAHTHALENASPINEYFCTEVRSRLTCDSCMYTRTQTEKYLYLSTDVLPDSGSTLTEGLQKFFAPEKRDIKCEKCFYETATQYREITRLPPALLFHFKRFIVDVSPDYTRVTYRKNQSAVEFPAELSLDANSMLSDFFAEDISLPSSSNQGYHIKSICNHIGSSASCGHYTTDANRLCQAGVRRWMRFNDSSVSQVDNALQSAVSTSYMALYEIQ